MRDPVRNCDNAGRKRSLSTMPVPCSSDIGNDRDWKHLTMQVPMSGQTFCGHSGQCLAGMVDMWQGMSAIADEALGAEPAIPSA